MMSALGDHQPRMGPSRRGPHAASTATCPNPNTVPLPKCTTSAAGAGKANSAVRKGLRSSSEADVATRKTLRSPGETNSAARFRGSTVGKSSLAIGRGGVGVHHAQNATDRNPRNRGAKRGKNTQKWGLKLLARWCIGCRFFRRRARSDLRRPAEVGLDVGPSGRLDRHAAEAEDGPLAEMHHLRGAQQRSDRGEVAFEDD